MDMSVHKLEIQQEMTIRTAASLNHQIMDELASCDELEVNLSQVVQIDTAGFQLMLMAKLDAAQMEKTLRFVEHSPAILALLRPFNDRTFLGDPLPFHQAKKNVQWHWQHNAFPHTPTRARHF